MQMGQGGGDMLSGYTGEMLDTLESIGKSHYANKLIMIMRDDLD